MIKHIFWSALIVPALTLSCGKVNNSSAAKDIGVVNTKLGSTKVLYADQNKVYLKVCKPPVAPPLTRNCLSDAVPKSIGLSDFLNLYKRFRDIGPYQANEQGLSLVTKLLQDAEDAAARGDRGAAETISRLTLIKSNLEKILKISKALGASQQDLTYYEYQDDFERLISPFSETGTGMIFVTIPKGTFLMGSPLSEQDRNLDEVQHRVTITYDFSIQTTAVTQEQWFAVMGDNPSKFVASYDCPGQNKQVNGVPMCPNNPVEQVSLDQAQEFIQKLNDKHGGSYRLPTEGEWEYAARGGSSGPYSVAGNIGDFAWNVYNSGGRTHPVGMLKPNSYGLYDVHGNVYQWTSDWYGDYPSSEVIDPRGPSSGSDRLIRGGSWGSNFPFCRSAVRIRVRPDFRGETVGFRLVRINP